MPRHFGFLRPLRPRPHQRRDRAVPRRGGAGGGRGSAAAEAPLHHGMAAAPGAGCGTSAQQVLDRELKAFKSPVLESNIITAGLQK